MQTQKKLSFATQESKNIHRGITEVNNKKKTRRNREHKCINLVTQKIPNTKG